MSKHQSDSPPLHEIYERTDDIDLATRAGEPTWNILYDGNNPQQVIDFLESLDFENHGLVCRGNSLLSWHIDSDSITQYEVIKTDTWFRLQGRELTIERPVDEYE